MVERVVVFIDWQNVYRRGQAAFDASLSPAHTVGQVHPLRLARRIVRKRTDARLEQVRVYRGIPTNHENPKGYAANRRQTAAWLKEDPSIHVYLRPLQYLPGLPPREKGIDVQLAIDYVSMAMTGDYDLGVLVSVDTDLKPALDAVYDMNGAERPWACVAAWNGPYEPRRRIAASGKRTVPCIWLDQADFAAASDPTDYGHS